MEFFKNTFTGQVISGNKKIVYNAGFEASRDYAEPKTTVTPTIQLLFSPFGLPYVPIEIIGTEMNKVITNLQFTKDRNNPGAIMQVTLVPDTTTLEAIVKVINQFSYNFYSTIWGSLGVDLEDLFKPMTLCQLWIDGYHIMTGNVRSCQRSSSIDNENSNVSYAIVIEELGNLYNMTSTSLDLIITDGMQQQIADSMKKALSVTANMKGVSLATGLQAILNAFLTSNLTNNVVFSDGFPLTFRLKATPNPIGGIANLSLASYLTMDTSMYQLNSGNGLQSVWSFMQSFVPSPWMEFYTESGGRTMVTDGLGAPSVLFPGFNYVVARTVPYSNPLIGTVNPAYLADTLLFDLTAIQMLIGGDFIIITDKMIQDKNLGFDSVNQYTVFRTTYGNRSGVSAANDQDRGIKSVGPLNPNASGGIPSFGIREMCQSVDCTSLIGLGVSQSYVERIAKTISSVPGLALTKNHLNNLLATWFRNQSRFREGQVTTKMIPYARPGMYCLYLPSLSGKKVENIRDIGIYYIDSLNHNYSMTNDDMQKTTTLNLIRGVPLPTSVAQTALLLFDYEIVPPQSGLYDGEYEILKNLRKAAAVV